MVINLSDGGESQEAGGGRGGWGPAQKNRAQRRTVLSSPEHTDIIRAVEQRFCASVEEQACLLYLNSVPCQHDVMLLFIESGTRQHEERNKALRFCSLQSSSILPGSLPYFRQQEK